MSVYRLSFREKRIFVMFIPVFFVFCLYMGVYRPLRAKQDVLRQQLLRAQTERQKQCTIIRRAQKLERQYGQEWSKFRQTEPDEQVSAGMVSDIESAVAETAVRITTMQPQGAQSTGNETVFSVQVTLEGALEQLMQCIYKLQTGERALGVVECSLEKSAYGADQVLARIALRRVLFGRE